MTTTVFIAITGNKACKVSTPQGNYLLQPGGHMNAYIHGTQQLQVEEQGEFVTPAPVLAFIPSDEGSAAEGANATQG